MAAQKFTNFDKFFKLYFIDYAITVVPYLPLCTPYSLSQSPYCCSCPWVMRIGSWLLHFLYCTLHLHGYSVTTYLYFLISSPLHPFSLTPLPSGNHQNAFCIHDSVSVLLICLACFLDSIVDRYLFLPFY